jgi:hypothetical protein
MAALQSHLLCPCQSPLTHLPGSLQTGEATRWTLGTHRPTGLGHPLERPPPGQPQRPDVLQISRPVCVCKVALSNRRIVCLKDRLVPFTSRTPGSARPRTTHLDAIEFLRRFLQHVLPAGCMKVRHFGFMHACCAIPTDTIRRMIVKPHPFGFQTTQVPNPLPSGTSCPICGRKRHIIRRVWTANRTFGDTG